MHDGGGDVVGAVVVVAVDREVALGDVVDNEAGLVTHRGDLGVLDGAQGVGDDGQARDAAAHGAHDLGVVQRHLDGLVGVAVVAVMDDVEGLDVGGHDHIL